MHWTIHAWGWGGYCFAIALMLTLFVLAPSLWLMRRRSR
jgi:hypothetical protein